MQMQEVALKWSKRWVYRCVAFECVVALGKLGDVADEQFKCVKKHCKGFKKHDFIKNVVKVRLNVV